MLACALLLAACGGDGAASTETAVTPSSTVSNSTTPLAPTPTPGAADTSQRASCDTPKPHSAGNSNETIGSGGLTRHYILHVPPRYDGTKKTPLVVNLHGAGSNAVQQAAYSRFPQKADRESFIVVSPDATGTPQAWNFLRSKSGSDDVGFIRDVLDRLDADLCIDDARIFATGISSGGAMSVSLGCSLPERFAAIAPVAALYFVPSCAATKPLPLMEFHGTDDPLVPFGGGAAPGGLQAPGVESAGAQWAKADGCPDEPARERFSEHVRSVAWSECKDGVAVVLFVVEGGGHTWPGAVDLNRLGVTTHEIDATDQIWQFFAAQTDQR